MSITTQTADLYALLNDLSEHINGHYQIVEDNDVTRVKYTKATLYDFRWITENIDNNLPYRIIEAKPYNEMGFELTMTYKGSNNDIREIRGN